MSMFSKFTDLARKALNPPASSGGSGNGSATDWREAVRQARDALVGDGKQTRRSEPNSGSRPRSTEASATKVSSTPQVSETDRAAIARYDYLLNTADPHQIEQVHREAFQRLNPSQREQIDQRMRAELPTHEHPRSSKPDDLARTAARTEAGHPGLLRGLLARAGSTKSRSGPGLAGGVALGGAAMGAGLAAGGLLTVVAGGAIVSSIAGPLLEQAASFGVDFEALASGINLETLTGGVEGLTGSVEGLTAGASESITGLGSQLSEFGSGFTLPGLDDLLGR
ncbi:hypothetical protein [Rhodoglobus sp.]